MTTLLTEDGCHARRKKLWAEVPDHIDWLVVNDARHVCYLSGFWVEPLSFSLGESSLLKLDRDGTTTLFADNFTRRKAVCDPFVSGEVIEKWYDHKHSVTNRGHALHNAFASACPSLDADRGVVESASPPTHGEFDLNSTLRTLRRSKHADEVALLQRCMDACAAGHARALEFIEPGVTELDVYREVQAAAMRSAGCPVLVYGDFRATNAEAPKAGGLPTDYVLAEGDLFILDYSVVIQGYRSDFTNTIAVGQPTLEQQRLFDTCVKALAAAEATLQAGTAAADVYAAASTVLEDGGYGPLAHHAGHGLGLGHPESPVFGPESTDELVIGDVVTIEPGAYIPGVGGVRVEHNCWITESGAERLSHHRIALR